MNVDPACFPCALSRVLCTAKHITDDSWLHHKLLDKAMQELADAGKDITPAELIFQLQGTLGKTLGSADPYHEQRTVWHDEVLALAESLQEAVQGADDPLQQALHIAAIGNVFDDDLLSVGTTRGVLRERLSAVDFGHSDEDLLRADLKKAKSVLFLHGTAPELLFDRVLLAQLTAERPQLEITSVVRSAPVLMHACAEDAEVYQIRDIPGVKEVMDPGIPALGTPLNECSREFRERFDQCDLVIAKGQAHYETLERESRTVYHLLRVKCEVVARKSGVKVGETALLRS